VQPAPPGSGKSQNSSTGNTEEVKQYTSAQNPIPFQLHQNRLHTTRNRTAFADLGILFGTVMMMMTKKDNDPSGQGVMAARG
jgi:hypothetical protein